MDFICLQGRCAMPARPMHSATIAGHRISVTVLPAYCDTERFTVEVDTNSYIGVLRQQIAAKCGKDPASLRLLYMGKSPSLPVLPVLADDALKSRRSQVTTLCKLWAQQSI